MTGILTLAWVFTYLGSAMAIGIWVTIRTHRKHGKVAAVLAAVFVLITTLVIPIWDILLTLPRYQQLCKQEAGLKIFGRMPLPKKFYSEAGEPLFFSRGHIDGYFGRQPQDKTDLYRYVQFRSGDEILRGTPVHIKKRWSCIVRRSNNEPLSCETAFATLDGWWGFGNYSCEWAGASFEQVQEKVFFADSLNTHSE